MRARHVCRLELTTEILLRELTTPSRLSSCALRTDLPPLPKKFLGPNSHSDPYDEYLAEHQLHWIRFQACIRLVRARVASRIALLFTLYHRSDSRYRIAIAERQAL